MQHWEYQFQAVESFPHGWAVALITKLNDWGKAGWEVVAAFPVVTGGGELKGGSGDIGVRTTVLIILKRPTA